MGTSRQDYTGPVLTGLFSVFASDLLPIFFIAGAGFALARWRNASAATLTHVVFYALLPCFAFHLLITTVATGQQFARMVLLAALVMIAMAAVGVLLSLALRLSRAEAAAFLLVVMFSNGGNYGLPVVSFAFGEEALSYGKNRVMFDRPIAGFQIQQERLADMLTEIVKAQLVSLHLGRLKDAGRLTPQQVSLAKRNNVDMATDIAREARRLLGAVGILAEYGAMRHMANLESVYTYEGTHDVHSLILGQAVTGISAFK